MSALRRRSLPPVFPRGGGGGGEGAATRKLTATSTVAAGSTTFTDLASVLQVHPTLLTIIGSKGILNCRHVVNHFFILFFFFFHFRLHGVIPKVRNSFPHLPPRKNNTKKAFKT